MSLILGTIDSSYMNYLSVEGLSKSWNEKVLFDQITFGLSKGDKVALSCPNLPYFPIVYYGILKTGAVVVPLNVLLKGREIAYHLGDSEAKAYFCFEGTAELPMLDVYMPMMKSAAIVSAGRLGLFEALAKGPLSVAQLAEKIQSSIKGVATLADFLIALGFIMLCD